VTDVSTFPGDAGCTGYFIFYRMSWSFSGTQAPYVDTSYLDTARQYQHERDNLGNALPVSCRTEVDGCPSRLLDLINVSVTDPEAPNAFANHTFFGLDPRPAGGQVLRVTLGSDYIDIGQACDAVLPQCYVPNWAIALANLLRQLDAQELTKKACTDVFGNP
jgi:hypothetical protein